MATIDEIFENMPAEASVTYEELIIDAESREILVPDAEAIFGVESDTHSERKYFRCPRYVGDGLDLASCFLRVNFRNANGDVDSYLVTDVSIDGEYITFSWELSRKVTAYKGAVQFNVCAIMGAGLPEWNTTLAEGLVLEGLEPDSSTVEAETADVIAQLLNTVAAQTAAVEAVGAAQRAEVQNVGENTTEEAKSAVEAKGEAVRASIPEDYSTLSATVDKLTRDRAAAIVCEAEGETIQVADSSADPLVGLRIFGKSTQNGTPTPDAPVEIVSAKAPTVTVCGKNLLHATESRTPTMANGVTFTSTIGSSEFVFGGTRTSASAASGFLVRSMPLSQGVYTLSVAGLKDTDYINIKKLSGEQRYLFTMATPENPKTFMLDEAAEVGVEVIVSANSSYNNDIVKVQIEVGEIATEYEPYNEAQTLALSTSDSLPGIPVTSGGNYTDANGQQWIADEVDLARGVYVQRVGTTAFNGSDGKEVLISTTLAQSPATNVRFDFFDPGVKNVKIQSANARQDILCNYTAPAEKANYSGAWLNEMQVFYGRISIPGDVASTVEELKTLLKVTPIVFVFPLDAPIETPLSTEELEAYKALLANKPTTTVLNDAGAWMALEYAADPKTYIDNKIAAILAANN